jgi:hypothetical protein
MPRKSAAALSMKPLRSGPTRLRPPASLSPPARRVFLSIVTNEDAAHFRPSHLPLLVQYCEAVCFADRSAAALRRDDAKAIWLVRWEKATRVMVALSMRLRLSPQSLAANNPTRPRPMSYYERQRLEMGDPDGI